jgi:hypothetical protein
VTGLTCDIVGAVTLTLGLFRHPRPLVPGWASGPNETARDQAFGIAGAALLLLGFVGQLLPDFGVRSDLTHERALVVAGVSLPAAVLLGLTVYSVGLLASYSRARRWAEGYKARTGGTGGFPWHFEWRPRASPFRMWALVNDDTGLEAGS